MTPEEFQAKIQRYTEEAQKQGVSEVEINAFVAQRTKEFQEIQQSRQVVSEGQQIVNPQTGEVVFGDVGGDEDLEEIAAEGVPTAPITGVTETGEVAAPEGVSPLTSEKIFGAGITDPLTGQPFPGGRPGAIQGRVDFGGISPLGTNIVGPAGALLGKQNVPFNRLKLGGF